MNYTDESTHFWRCVMEAVRKAGTNLSGLNKLLHITDGTLEIMLENDMLARGELMRRIGLFTGMSERELVCGDSADTLKALRQIFVLSDAEFVKPYYSIDDVISNILVDVPRGDAALYDGMLMQDNSMSSFGISMGDTLIVRRQYIADDGDIVVAAVDGKIVVRLYLQVKNDITLKAESIAGDAPPVYTDRLNAAERKMRILGKVVGLVRRF